MLRLIYLNFDLLAIEILIDGEIKLQYDECIETQNFKKEYHF